MAQGNLFGEALTAASPPGPDSPPSPARHTWFFALRPSVEDAERIHALTEKLVASHGISGRRIAAERLHITLELVGHDVDAAMVDLACCAADAIRFPSIDARFDAAMTFSAPSGPFVLLGGAGLDQVRALRSALGCAMADLGFMPPRAYELHMTLCYDPRHRAARMPIEPVGFRAAEFALVKSHIGFSRHEVLRTWQLAA